MCVLVLLVACEEERPKDESQFIEYIEVRGTCSEDHVKQSADYEGSIVHWYNVTKNRHARYGNVHQWGEITERIMEEVKNPHRYYPPPAVDFNDLDQDQITGDELHLKGISDHLGGEQGDAGPHYETTCDLKVVRRLDHLPPVEERN